MIAAQQRLDASLMSEGPYPSCASGRTLINGKQNGFQVHWIGKKKKKGINDVACLGTRLLFKPVTDEAAWL